MPPTRETIERLMERLRLETPLVAVYDSGAEAAFEHLIEAQGNDCCFAFYPRWLAGETVIFRKGGGGCMGAQMHLGLKKGHPPWMAHFLTDGKGGAPMGEGLRASPEIAQKFLDQAVPPEPSGDAVLLGPLRLDLWEHVRSVTFLVDPDRLSAVMTLAGFWSDDTRLTSAPFSSGCGLLWKELQAEAGDRPILGATDMAMRRYLPPEILAYTVTPARLEQMLTFPEDSFLYRDWWNGLMDERERSRKEAAS